MLAGGRGGIRTPGTSRFNGFQDRLVHSGLPFPYEHLRGVCPALSGLFSGLSRLFHCRAQIAIGRVGIAHRRRDAGVAELFLNQPEVTGKHGRNNA